MINESDAIADYANSKIYDVDLKPMNKASTSKEALASEEDYKQIVNLLQVALRTSIHLLEGGDKATDFELAGLREAQEISARFLNARNP